MFSAKYCYNYGNLTFLVKIKEYSHPDISEKLSFLSNILIVYTFNIFDTYS